MKVLHLFSNSKWTGPAEPALRLCLALRELGVEVDFACAPGDVSRNKIVRVARDHGMEPILDMNLCKHAHLVKNLADRRALFNLLRRGDYDLIHCHLENDHRIAMPVAKRLGIPLVRSSYEGVGVPGRRQKSLLRTAALVVEPSHIAMAHDIEQFQLDPAKVVLIPPAVELKRFDPGRNVPDGRKALDIPASAFVAGIVARMQAHRHYDVFFTAVSRLVHDIPQAHIIIVGRGTRQEQVAHEPVRRLGLEQHVHFAGFLDGDAYVGMVKAFDVKVFMKPGTDGTCRAVREAMAMGKAAVVADRGMLRELVDDGENGIVFDGTAEALHQALKALATDPERLRRMGAAARDKALREWSPEGQAREVSRHYQRILDARTTIIAQGN